MKDSTKENAPDGNGDDERNDFRDETLLAYTPQQRRAILKGLRILARVAIRSYMREQAEHDQAEEDGSGEGSF